MCSGSEAGSYVRLIEFVYHSTLGLRVIKKKSGVTVKPSGPGKLGSTETCIAYGWHSPRVFPAHRASTAQSSAFKREFKLPWREAGPPNHHDDKVVSDQ